MSSSLRSDVEFNLYSANSINRTQHARASDKKGDLDGTDGQQRFLCQRIAVMHGKNDDPKQTSK
eukprot:scaffold411931_cov19-Prasinocladus_malaysianus.AAC.1